MPPSPGTEDTPIVKVLSAEFGDGYTQATPDGLNHIRRVLKLTWDVSDEAAPLQWTCREWSDRRGRSGFRSVTATLTQAFSPG